MRPIQTSVDAAEVANNSLLDVQRYMDVVRRRRGLMLTVFAAVFLLVFAVMMSLPKTYTASAQLFINMHGNSALDLHPKQDNGDAAVTDVSRIETEMQVLQSRELIENVLKVVGPPPKAPSKPGLGLGFRKAVRDFVASAIPKQKKALVDGTDPAHEAIVLAMSKGLKVKREGASYVIDVSYEAKNPVYAARAANAFVDQYIAYKVKSEVGSTEQANAWLSTTLDGLTKQVMEADAAVASYRSSHGLAQVGAETINQQTMAAIGQQLVISRAAEAEAQARYNTAKEQLAKGSSGEDVGEALASPVVTSLRAQRAQVSQNLADLKSRYGPKHPDVAKSTQVLADIDAQIQAEVRRILSNLSAQAQVARQRTASLEGSLARENSAVAVNDSASVGLNELLRKQEAARTTYQEYLSRFKQTSAEQDLPHTDARVMSHGTPPMLPSAPVPLKVGAIAFAAGLLSAIVALLVAELLLRGFLEPDEVERSLGVPAFASIPTLNSSAAQGRSTARFAKFARAAGLGRFKFMRRHLPADLASPADYAVGRPLSAFAEVFRSLRTSLIRSGADEAPLKVIAITSAAPNEGKTTTSLCLGHVSALGSTKTVVVDCDFRRAAVTQRGAETTEKGLVQVLEGAATLDEVMVVDPRSGLWRVPVGGSVPAHLNLIEMPQMAAVLQQLRDRFELVILDTSPVLAVADARLLARQADTTLVLVRWGKTPRNSVEAALRELLDVGANVAGVALTQVDLEYSGRASSIPYYNSEYANYYQA